MGTWRAGWRARSSCGLAAERGGGEAQRGAADNSGGDLDGRRAAVQPRRGNPPPLQARGRLAEARTRRGALCACACAAARERGAWVPAAWAAGGQLGRVEGKMKKENPNCVFIYLVTCGSHMS